MYTIEADGEMVHDDSSSDIEYSALSAVLTMEMNKAGTLSFILPPQNYALKKGYLKTLKTVISVKQKEHLLWNGRILDTNKDFYGNVTFNCEGWMGVLNDSILRPDPNIDKDTGISVRADTFFTELIRIHNTMCPDKALVAHTIGTFSGNSVFPAPSYDTILDYIHNNFIESEYVGGRMSVWGTNAYYYSDEGPGTDEENDQEIVFGENLLNYAEQVNGADLYTIIIPIGKDDLDITSVNGGLDYIENSTASTKFGKIWHYENFNDIDNAATLKSKATTMLNNNIASKTTINVSAFDLNLLNPDVEYIDVGKFTRVISEPNGVDVWYRCSGCSIDLLNPGNSTFVLGTNPDTLTGKQTKLTKEVKRDSKYISVNKRQTIPISAADTTGGTPRVEILGSMLSRYGGTATLSFSCRMLVDVTVADLPILKFSSKYAPTSVVTGVLSDDTTNLMHSFRVKSSGQITIYDAKGEISTNDVVSGSISWTY